MNIEDNGDSGDGIIVEIATDATTQEDGSLVWFALTLRGAMAIRDTLDHILTMRKVEADESRDV